MAANDDINMTNARAIKARIKDAMRKWRAARQLSQAEAASLLGISRRTYEKYEGDPVRGVPYAVLARLCLVADIDAEWVLLGRKRRKTASPSVPARTKVVRKILKVA